MDSRIRVAVIIGSTREGRFGPTVARWVADLVRQRADMVVDVIDLAVASGPLSSSARCSPSSTPLPSATP